MKMVRALIGTVAMACSLTLALPAAAQTVNNWSFYDIVSRTTVSGTISGVRNGSNNANGLSILVKVASPSLTGNYSFSPGGQYDAIDGVIQNGFIRVYNSSAEESYAQLSTIAMPNYSEIINYATLAQATTGSTATTFSLAAAPEPGSWALMILGFGIVGYAMRRRRVTFKHSFA